MKIEIEIDDVAYRLLQTLTLTEFGPETVEGVVERLINHAQQGIYRPGAWERDWLSQAFSDDFTEHLKPGDPYGRSGCEGIFQQPKTLLTIV